MDRTLNGFPAACLALVAAAIASAAPPEAPAAGDLRARIEEARTGDLRIALQAPSGAALPGVEAQVELVRHDFLFGCNLYAFDSWPDPERNRAYREAFEGLFNYATIPFYWKGYEPERGKRDHSRNLRMAEWCAARGIAVKGHPLAWTDPAGVPPWLPALAAAETRAAVMDRVQDAVRVFRGRVWAWDVINEPVHTPPFAGFGDRVSQEVQIYTAVRAGDPAAKLVLNEYHVMSELAAGDFHAFVERCLAAGAPIDAVGIQAHEPRFAAFEPDRVEAVLDRFADLGKEVHLTELAFTSGGQKVLRRREGGRFGETGETWTEDLQARVVEEIYRRAFAHRAVAAITWWDLADGRSWLPGGGLLRADLTAKPAYGALRRLIREEWTTRAAVRADGEGALAFRGFFGTYRVRARAGGRDLEGLVRLGKAAPRGVLVLAPAGAADPAGTGSPAVRP